MLRRDLLAAMAGLGAAAAVGTGQSATLHAEAAAIPTIPGPDPDTHTPTFKPPAGTIDTHTHIFGPAARYPFAAKRPYSPPDAPLEMFRALHHKIGVERA